MGGFATHVNDGGFQHSTKTAAVGLRLQTPLDCPSDCR